MKDLATTCANKVEKAKRGNYDEQDTKVYNLMWHTKPNSEKIDRSALKEPENRDYTNNIIFKSPLDDLEDQIQARRKQLRLSG